MSSRLDRFSQKKDDLYNFRCPLCGDSKKNTLKARGYVHRKANDYYYMCHNCGASTTFGNFLKSIDETMYRQYTLDRYKDGENGRSNYKKPKFVLSGPKPTERLIKQTKIPLPTISDLPEDHDAKKYVLSRKIPSKYFGEIFYSDNIEQFLRENYPEAEVNFHDSDRRIVLFHTDEEDNVSYIVGRSIEPQASKRYVKVKVTDGEKIFGLNRVDKSKTIYVVEGQFDSFFLCNAVAAGNSNLVGVAEKFSKKNVVLLYDVQPRNKDILKQIERSIEKDYKVCLLPDTLPGKDINEFIINGIQIEYLMSLVTKYTYSGLSAKLEFTRWRKC